MLLESRYIHERARNSDEPLPAQKRAGGDETAMQRGQPTLLGLPAVDLRRWANQEPVCAELLLGHHSELAGCIPAGTVDC